MYLVTGARGQLGTELRALLKDSAIYVDRHELDITSEITVRNFFDKHHFDCVINCAAYTAVDKAEDEPSEAEAVNHLGVRWLAKYGKCIIHISTDYVFDGIGCIPYRESDQTNPVSVYGQTKLQGEKAVLDNAETGIIIRTAWLYSATGNNFVKTMLRLGKARESLNVVFDQVGSPTNAADLANAIVKVLPQIQVGTKNIYHFSNEGVCSWYDFACTIMQMAHLSCHINPILSKDYPTKAVRPYYSLLDKSKIKQDFGLKIRHWQDALRNLMENYKELL